MKYGIMFIGALCLLTFASQIYAQTDAEAASSLQDEEERYMVLLVRGEVLDDLDDPLKGVEVTLYERNTVVSSMRTNGKGKYKFSLLNDYIYTLEFVQDGYVLKRVSINTHMPGDDGSLYEYVLDMAMMPDAEANEANQSLLDFPITILGFDRGRDNFYIDMKYTSSLNKEIRASKSD